MTPREFTYVVMRHLSKALGASRSRKGRREIYRKHIAALEILGSGKLFVEKRHCACRLVGRPALGCRHSHAHANKHAVKNAVNKPRVFEAIGDRKLTSGVSFLYVEL